MEKISYNDNVFINCPFDIDYINLFRAIIFTVVDAGFIPRCSKEIDDGTEFRLGAIVSLIDECRYGIHDLSRVELDKENSLPRFNMPFELGIFWGSKKFGNDDQQKKKCIILEKDQYRYQKFISDLSGVDVKAHSNNLKNVIFAVRNWLVTASRRTTIPEASHINKRFRQFQIKMRKICNVNGSTYDSMPFIELVQNMTDWLSLLSG